VLVGKGPDGLNTASLLAETEAIRLAITVHDAFITHEPKTIHPAHPMKTRPPARLTNWFPEAIFSSRTKALILATHKRFITPKANRITINAQQQPRQ